MITANQALRRFKDPIRRRIRSIPLSRHLIPRYWLFRLVPDLTTSRRGMGVE